MTKYEVKPSGRFRRDFKLMRKQEKDLLLLRDVVEKLANGIPLPESNRDHGMTGGWAGHRECHIQPDWLLIYRKEEDVLVLVLTRTGSHSDLFQK